MSGLMRAIWLLLLVTACVAFDHGERAKPDDPVQDPGGGGSGSGSGSAGYATPHVVQSPSQFGILESSIVVSIAPAHAGNTIVVGAISYSDQGAVERVAADSTMLRSAGARATVLAGATEIWYGPASAGMTTVTVAFGNSFGGGVWVLEVEGLDSAAPDVAQAPDLTIASLINAPPVTARTPNSLVFSLTDIPGGGVAGIHAGNAFHMLTVENGDSSAFAIAAAPGSYAAAWDASGADSACASTAAFAAAKL